MGLTPLAFGLLLTGLCPGTTVTERAELCTPAC